jgi:hypothetical protein
VSRRSLFNATIDSVAGCEGKHWVSPSLLERVQAFLLCRKLDDGSDIVLTYNVSLPLEPSCLDPSSLLAWIPRP